MSRDNFDTTRRGDYLFPDVVGSAIYPPLAAVPFDSSVPSPISIHRSTPYPLGSMRVVVTCCIGVILGALPCGDFEG